MSLEKLRNQIDKIDNKIIALLKKRLQIAKNIKKFKKNIKDSKREEKILAKIDSIYIQDIYKAIFKNSKKLQKDTNDISTL